MLAIFSLRLALGMLGSLFLLSPSQMHPRFFRTHFLTVLGLCIVGLFIEFGRLPWWVILTAAALALIGSVVWAFELTRFGWILLVLTTATVAFLLWES